MVFAEVGMTYTKVEIHGVEYATKMKKWCRRTIGMPKGPDGTLKFSEMIWYHTPYYKNRQDYGDTIHRFYFRNPVHATLFALRWL
jgi:hypothetical protein